MLLVPYVCFHILSSVWVAEWPPVEKMTAHSSYNMFSKYKYLIVNLVFPPQFLECEFLSDIRKLLYSFHPASLLSINMWAHLFDIDLYWI